MDDLHLRSESPHKGKAGLERIWLAFGFSAEGLKAALRNEDAFRQELILAGVLIPVAWFCHVPSYGKAIMIASVMLVLIVELLNSAVEAAVDRISFENHQLAKRAKDMGSAAVFLAIINVVIVWLVILLSN
ncbi:MAG: diacylglycerol kinase [Burkholderiales bacterium]|nr:diacylglycerol kinase [Pseudomonadota bacterium]